MTRFKLLAAMFSASSTRSQKLYCVSSALSLVDIDVYINKHKDGWNGTEGQFARVLARMLSQLD